MSQQAVLAHLYCVSNLYFWQVDLAGDKTPASIPLQSLATCPTVPNEHCSFSKGPIIWEGIVSFWACFLYYYGFTLCNNTHFGDDLIVP